MCQTENAVCCIPLEKCRQSNRCFISGEHCSMQSNIQREREKLHDSAEGAAIQAFVIMAFSDMSDIVYKWRIKPFVESLKKYLWFDSGKNRLYCTTDEAGANTGDTSDTKGHVPVKEIHVVRSDTDPVSNYVVCNRICQQIQIADLVIVDVSQQNTNVFYEFGLAVSLGKLILPICYSESFYKRKIPEKQMQDAFERDTDAEKKKTIEKHIGNYPWRKMLFEHFGIFYKNNESNGNAEKMPTHYIDYSDACNADYGFEDIKYSRFPYHDKIQNDDHDIMVGQLIYEMLQRTYNNAQCNDSTLAVYTLEKFLNKHDACRCIVNFYNRVTAKMKKSECFCGDRVGVLVQSNLIPDDDKDAKQVRHLFYNLAEIIHIGMNQALYESRSESIKPEDYLTAGEFLLAKLPNSENLTESYNEICQHIKEYVGNRSLMIYPEHPVYVSRLKTGLQDDVLSMLCHSKEEKRHCLYDISLKTLRHVNEIVVDISKSCLQSLFWLGAAHGFGINAITVLHEETPQEQEIVAGTTERKERSIFDIAGLWSAVFRSNDTEGFQKQFMQVQRGIERQKKLGERSEHKGEKDTISLVDKLKLESYYRDCFWKRMLQYNQLHLYLCHHNEKPEHTNDLRISVSKWDIDAISILSKYLSRRSVIGEYQFSSIYDNKHDTAANQQCVITVGKDVNPIENGITNKEQYNICQNFIFPDQDQQETYEKNCTTKGLYKGFWVMSSDDPSEAQCIATWHPMYQCVRCKQENANETGNKEQPYSDENIYGTKTQIQEGGQCHPGEGTHSELAQLLIWWQTDKEESNATEAQKKDSTEAQKRYFRVELNGTSGPATLGLATLFVDEMACKQVFPNHKKESTLLYNMQKYVREEFLSTYTENLFNKLKGPKSNGDDKFTQAKSRYMSLIIYSSYMYLSTVLYQYFLPLLTEQDVERICNGLDLYIKSMRAADVVPFAIGKTTDLSDEDKTKQEAAELCTSVLRESLNSFVGIEMLYTIKVHARQCSDKNDTREVQDITECQYNQNGKKLFPKCLFKPMRDQEATHDKESNV